MSGNCLPRVLHEPPRALWRAFRKANKFLCCCLFTPVTAIWRFVTTRLEHQKILLYGLEGAGKTTILYWLKLGIFIQTLPTSSIIAEKFSVAIGNPPETWFLHIIEIRRSAALSSRYDQRLKIKDALKVVFVIDSLDRRRLAYARDEIVSLLYDDGFFERGGKLLIFANKQDIRSAMSTTEIIDSLELPKEWESRWLVTPTSALVGTGILEGLHWLLNGPNQHPQSLHRGYASNFYCQARQHLIQGMGCFAEETLPLVGADDDADSMV